MIKLSNGYAFDYVTASALWFDGKGWPWEQPLRWAGLLDPSLFLNVTKTITFFRREGNMRWYNPFRCVRLLPGGVHNAIDLSNPGFDWWARKVGKHVDSKKIALALSLYGNKKELAEMARISNDFDVVAIEYDAYCPNAEDGNSGIAQVISGCEAIAEHSRHPLIVKLPVVEEIEEIVEWISDFAQAFSINSVKWEIIFPGRKSPLARFGGGAVSGKIAQPYTWGMVKKLVRLTNVPVIGPSVWDYEDIAKVRALGAKAVSFGSVFMLHPWRPTLFVRREMRQNN